MAIMTADGMVMIVFLKTKENEAGKIKHYILNEKQQTG